MVKYDVPIEKCRLGSGGHVVVRLHQTFKLVSFVIMAEARRPAQEDSGSIPAKGSPKKISFDKLGILSQPGGGLTESQLFCKIVKTKLTFVNGQKCDETHNT